MLASGTVLQGRYRIDSRIGGGGMGAVYHAWGLHLKKWLAIKEMSEQFQSQKERDLAIAQFQKEASILANLDHPNLPKVLDYFEESGHHYLVMDFVEGKTLEEILKGSSTLPAEKGVIKWLLQILDVLEYLHLCNPPVIFRDLKPANIMLTPQGQIKLIDFGIAKIFDPTVKTGTAIRGTGSPGFSPLEQYGKGKTDARSDIYALGCTVYYLLTGLMPPESIDRLLHSERVVPIKDRNPSVSQSLAAAVDKMMELEADKRFQSVAGVKAALGGAAVASSVSAPSTTRAIVSSSLGAAGSPSMSVTTVSSEPAPSPLPLSPAKPARKSLLLHPVLIVLVLLGIVSAGYLAYRFQEEKAKIALKQPAESERNVEEVKKQKQTEETAKRKVEEAEKRKRAEEAAKKRTDKVKLPLEQDISRVRFKTGSISSTINWFADPSRTYGFKLKISEGQLMTIILSGNGRIAGVQRYYDHFSLPARSKKEKVWEGYLPDTTDYLILVTGSGRLSLYIEIPP